MEHSQIESEHKANDKFCQQLIRPIEFKCDRLLANQNQVAGHAGFCLLQDQSGICLKPFNSNCVRGKREHLFYQLVEYFKRQHDNKSSGYLRSETSSKEPTIANTLHYNQFTLLTYSSPATKCNCIINEALFKLLSSFVANFYHVKHLSKEPDDHSLTAQASDNSSERAAQFLNLIFSNQLTCPCYGRNPAEKSICAREYEKVDFLCLEDLTAHCRKPCIIDIKIGQITYDPLAIKEKVIEQSSKYRQLREFGFRILGMKLVDQIKDKSFGKALKTTEQVYKALDSFLIPLNEDQGYICAVVEQILSRLRQLLGWFERDNINQLRFYSSSLLIVYDSYIEDKDQPTSVIHEELANNVRVSMIDFAHVFHVHNPTDEADVSRDENYMFGLRKLEKFFAKLKQDHQYPHPPPE